MTNCKNCGAPVDSDKCKYCGTVYYIKPTLKKTNPVFLKNLKPSEKIAVGFLILIILPVLIKYTKKR